MSAIPVLLGIDGGSTKTAVRVSAVDDSFSVRTLYTKEGTNLKHIHPSTDRTRLGRLHLDAAIQQAVEAVVMEQGVNRTDLELAAVCIGTAGLDVCGDRAAFKRVFRGCRSLRPLRASRIAVMSDVEIIAACSQAPIRLCLIAGTGSNTYAIRTDRGRKEEAFVGGLDLPLTDEGSAAWIGLRACTQALQLANRGQLEHPLVKGVYGALGIDLTKKMAWREIQAAYMARDKAQLAALCQNVVAPLAQQGEQEARRLLNEAGVELNRMAKTALGLLRVDTFDVVDVLLVGGVWNNKIVHDTFCHCLGEFQRLASPGLRDRFSRAARSVRQVDPTLGAIQIAHSLL